LTLNVKNTEMIFPLLNQLNTKLPQGLSIKIVYNTN
jgi:hypothetical protein